MRTILTCRGRLIKPASLCSLSLLVILCLTLTSVRHAQGQETRMDHAGHGNQMEMTSGDSLVWRMVPMDMAMPMLPGLENAVPLTGAYLPGVGMDPMMFPEGKPREVLDLKDGDTIHLEASLIRRTIGDRTFIMYGYNQQYPGPLLRAERGASVTVHFVNNIELPTTVHWHGLRLDNNSDGVPGVTQAPVMTGESFTYTLHFRDTGLYWYHPHMREDIQQDLGLYGYNQQYPGPLLRAVRGASVTVHFVNNIELPTTVHWHGLRLDNNSDGVPGVTQAPVMTGESFTYTLHFRDTGLYWYHPHMREDIQQDLGLYGNMLIDPPETDYYAPANREEVIILDDLLMDATGLFPFGESTPTHALMGRFGNVMLVNGQTTYSLDVNQGDVVRFYLTNVANSRTFNVVMDGAPMKVIASDVSKYERDQWAESIVISPAERYVVDVRFDESRTYQMTNTIQAINHFRGEFYPRVDTLGSIRVGLDAASPDLADSFLTLRENADVQADIDNFRQYFDREPDHSLVLSVRVKNLPLSIMRMMEIDTLYVPPMEWNDAMPMMNWLSGGEQVEWIIRDVNTGRENMELGWKFRTGDVSKIRIFNDPKTFHPMNHPFHMHGQRFLVLSVDGVRNPNMVWKDTVIVPVGSTVDILLDADNPGKWMAHCHIAEHLHAGMMMMFEVVDELDPQ